MITFFFKNRKTIIFLLLCFFSFFIIVQNLNFKNSLLNIILFPFCFIYKTTNNFSQFISNSWYAFFNTEKIQQENKLLYRKIIILTKKLQEMEKIKEENINFRKLLEFHEISPYSFIYAQILTKDPVSWFNTLMIDKGKEDGIESNMIVVVEKGVVGKIIAVNSNISFIQTLLDGNCKIGVKIERTNECGVLEGQFTSFFCRLKYLSLDTTVKKGDVIITSGLGEIFPEGLKIGEVIDVKSQNYELFPQVIVKPYVNFNVIEEVMIIKKEIK